MQRCNRNLRLAACLQGLYRILKSSIENVTSKALNVLELLVPKFFNFFGCLLLYKVNTLDDTLITKEFLEDEGFGFIPATKGN